MTDVSELDPVDGASPAEETLADANRDADDAVPTPTPAPVPRRPSFRAPSVSTDQLRYGVLLLLVLAVGAYFRFLGPHDPIAAAADMPPGENWLKQFIRAGDWDVGQHLHPDERFLTDVAQRLALPKSWNEYLDSQTSPLNPRNRGKEFFVYGTWPMTLVFLVAEKLQMTDYGSVNLVGRRLMAVFDLLAIVLLYMIGCQLYGRRVGLLAAALAAVTAFSIQQSHFFTVDTAANFFVLLALYAALDMMRRRGWADIVFTGLALGMALASKISIWPLVPLVVFAWYVAGLRDSSGNDRRSDGDRSSDNDRSPNSDQSSDNDPLAGRDERSNGDKPSIRDWRTVLDWRSVVNRRWLGGLLLLGVVTFLTLRVTQPDMWAGPGWSGAASDPLHYADMINRAPAWWRLIDRVVPDAMNSLLLPEPRWAENMQRIRDQISGHGMDWPPNHQWFGRIPYVFPLRNMVLYGMGFPLGIAAWLAWIVAAVQLLRGRRRHLLPVVWVALVFGLLGGGWVTTMRYFLPIYPMLTLLAAWGLVAGWDWARARNAKLNVHAAIPATTLGTLILVLAGTAIWGFMFAQIYTRAHSRVAGTRWIYHNIPAPLVLTVADGASSDQPIGQSNGKFMPVSNPDTLSFHDGKYVIETDRRLDRARVLIPGDRPVKVDGAQLSYLTDPAGDAAPERFHAWLTTKPYPDAQGHLDGIVAEGEVEANLSSSREQDVKIPFPTTELAAGGEYYVWVDVQGAPVAGRMAVLANETDWDDAIPLGMDGYAAFDNPESEWGEGFYFPKTLQLYDEDDAGKLDRVLDDLQKSDYLTISSNRVYGAIAQVPTRYPLTLHYYDLLFSGRLGFEHVADIHSYPSLGPIEVNDQPADEAFHVYDHPKVDIFRRSAAFDPVKLRAELTPYLALRTWQWPSEPAGGLIGRLVAPLLNTVLARADASSGFAPAGQHKPEDLMLSPDRVKAERAGQRWTDLFNPDNLINRQPILAVLLWYAVLLLLGIVAFPLVWLALPNLHDRGWAVARVAGLLFVSWLAWLVASLRWAPHAPWLSWLALAAMAGLSGLALWRTGPAKFRAWLRANWRQLLLEEGVYLALFAFFLVVRMGNPDLWHPSYGGEKPMDFAYLNATLRTVSFPPFDPWFAGGKMNYYYFGFVFIGTLMQMTAIVPWIAYNLAIPALASMTGLGVFGVVYNWTRRLHRKHVTAVLSAAIGSVLAVASGNLFQVQFIANELKTRAPEPIPSQIPGLMDLQRLIMGWWLVVAKHVEFYIRPDWVYWNASRAIPWMEGEVQPITEFPFFTFLYADLHAHMMALPITVLALTVALSWALPSSKELSRPRRVQLWSVLRLLLGALAIGALWPTNTWDFPTYGLVAAGAIAIGQWKEQRGWWRRRPTVLSEKGLGWLNVSWLMNVAVRGAALLIASLLLFLPYHQAYIQPYSSFRLWEAAKTPPSAYLTIHGIFLFAIATWVLVSLGRSLRDPEQRKPILRLALVAGTVVAMAFTYLWMRTTLTTTAIEAPSPWTPAIGWFLLTLSLVRLLHGRTPTVERFAAWILVVGVLATQFVEYVVLEGDIGRMNTVFKFYIQVWILWAVLAAVAFAWLVPVLRRAPWRLGQVWKVAFTVLIMCGLLYTVTATKAKWTDRFPAMGSAAAEGPEAYAKHWQPGIDGIAYQDYAVYDDDGHDLSLKYDRDAFQWLLRNIEGVPVILEGFRQKGYSWGARYSIYTGLPSVLGWDFHQKQQRAGVGGEVVDERMNDVGEMYQTTDVARAWELLDKYRVEYVIVGEMETAFYPPEGLAKFDQMVAAGKAKVVYGKPDNPVVTIYHLVRPEGSLK